ncbi:MAG: hypothetical protein CEE40_07620 [Chloroflexi bacterium B3_Chlor]|nr:MAG: hypothetical protein CEE40_07620 [Chloroflexi bacterium B3_Chlor]
MRNWVRKWRWHIIVSLLISAILVCLLVGYVTQDQFVRDFTANLAADAVVALVAFAVLDVALGLRKRKQRQTETRQKAVALLAVEVSGNQFLLWGMLQELNGDVPMRQEWDALCDDRWTLFIQSPLVADLDQDLLRKLTIAYGNGEEAVNRVRGWRSDPTFSPWDDPPANLISEVEQAHEQTWQALKTLFRGY